MIWASIRSINMECIVLERYLDMVSSGDFSVKISEEFDFLDTSL